MKETQGNTLCIWTIISAAFLLLFLFLFMFTSYGVKIQRISISKSLFDTATNKYDFSFSDLGSNIIYNVKLRLAKKENVDYSDVFKHQRNFGIKITLLDSTNQQLVKQDINEDSKIPSVWAKDYIEFTLARFEARSHNNYYLSLDFNNNGHFFDLFKPNMNEVFIQEDFDYAAMPWIKAIHSLSKALLLVSLISTVIMISLLIRNKKNKSAAEGA